MAQTGNGSAEENRSASPKKKNRGLLIGGCIALAVVAILLAVFALTKFFIPTSLSQNVRKHMELFPESQAVSGLAVLPGTDESDRETETEAAGGAASLPVTNGGWNQLPGEFVFSSGAGGWATTFELNSDGSFTGEYYDGEMGSTGAGYPNGTVYISSFSGRFSQPERKSEFCYVMKLEELTTEGTVGSEYISDDIRYIVSEPYGFDHADEFYLYLPGMPVAEVEEGFLSWSFLDTEIRKTLPSGYYGIYNVGGEEGFVGIMDSCLWNRQYIYEHDGCRSELWPSYFGESSLVFWPGDGAASINLSFPWQEDDQTEFDAVDSRSGSSCHISLDFNEDQTCVFITVTGAAGMDLSAWGGTANGQFSAEFQEKTQSP